MNWIRENKFLACFSAIMVVGVGALAFLLISAIGNYDATHNKYTSLTAQLNALQNRQPYPNSQNLEDYQKQTTALATVIENLEQKLSAVQFPLDPTMTPAKFQAKLQATVIDEITKAKATGVTLPDKFALGFDRYLTAPPVQAAAAPLERELRAMQFLFDELLDSTGVQSISSTPPVFRAPLPEEETGGKPSTGLVVKSPVEISFVANPTTVRKILNDLVETNKQFYIVRLVQIRNQGDKELAKTDAWKNMKDKAGNLQYVLGTEKLEVTLSLEIVNFNPPPK